MSSTPIPMRDVFIDRLYELGSKDRDVVFISADFGAPALDRFREDLSGQFIHSGIAEQHMIDMAGGLAIAGKKVYTYGMAPFISLRCLEQVKCSLSMMELPVTILSVGVGLGYGRWRGDAAERGLGADARAGTQHQRDSQEQDDSPRRHAVLLYRRDCIEMDVSPLADFR